MPRWFAIVMLVAGLLLLVTSVVIAMRPRRPVDPSIWVGQHQRGRKRAAQDNGPRWCRQCKTNHYRRTPCLIVDPLDPAEQTRYLYREDP